MNGMKTLVSNRLMRPRCGLSVKSSSRWADIGLRGTVRAEHVRSGSQAADKYEAAVSSRYRSTSQRGRGRVRRNRERPSNVPRSVREPGRVFNSQLTLGLYKGLFNIIQFIRSQLTVACLLHVFDNPEAM